MRKRALAVSCIGWAVFSGFGGASPSLSDVCGSSLRNYLGQVTEGATLLDSLQRTLAAVTPVQKPQQKLEQNQDWQDWAMQRLEETQQLLDLAEVDRGRNHEARRHLAEAANLWVEFYAYARQGDRSRMQERLRLILRQTEAARSLACK